MLKTKTCSTCSQHMKFEKSTDSLTIENRIIFGKEKFYKNYKIHWKRRQLNTIEKEGVLHDIDDRRHKNIGRRFMLSFKVFSYLKYALYSYDPA